MAYPYDRQSGRSAERFGLTPGSMLAAGGPGAPPRAPPRGSQRGYDDDPRDAYMAELMGQTGVTLSAPFPVDARGAARALAPARPAPAGSVRERIDVHELMRREADVVRPPPDQRGLSDQYVVLDSFAKDAARSNLPAGVFAWNFMVQGSTGRGAVGVRDKVDRVTEVQIANFAMPVLPNFAYPVPTVSGGAGSGPGNNTTPAGALVPGSAPFPLLATNSVTLGVPATVPFFSQVACGGRLTVQLVEAGLQSFSSLAGTRYHFDLTIRDRAPVGATGDPGVNPTEFDAGVPGLPFTMPLSVSPPEGWDTYMFTDPLMDVHGLTLAFRNPDAPVQFSPDVLYSTSVVLVSLITATFPLGPPPVPAPIPPIPTIVAFGPAAAGTYYLTFNYTAHGLLSGDQVVIAGFNSGNAALDAYINRPQGHLVGTPRPQSPAIVPTPVAQGVAIPTPNSFTLDPTPDVTNLIYQYWVPSTVLVTNADGSATNPPQYRTVIGSDGSPVMVGIPTYWLPPQSVDVFVLKRRVRIPMRLRRAVDRPTNDIVSVH